MGTASLRSMPNDTSDKVLAAVRGVLAESGFKFQEEWVRVLGGTEEGLWGWVAINYATGALQGVRKGGVGNRLGLQWEGTRGALATHCGKDAFSYLLGHHI